MVPSEGPSEKAKPETSKKVQVSSTKEALPVRLFGVGGDDGTAPGEARLPEEHVPRSFTEQGKILMTHCLPFQGPDIDPYLRYALKVDVAKLMTELGGIIGGPSSTEASAQAANSSQPAAFLESLSILTLKVIASTFLFILDLVVLLLLNVLYFAEFRV
jgi:hypothetical protein